MTKPTDEAEIIVTDDDGVLEIVIDRSGRMGSLRLIDQLKIVETLERASTDDSLRVVLIRSNGNDFSSGADWVAANSQGGSKPRTGSLQRRTPLQTHRLIALLWEIQLPVVCAVRGWAAGLGCQIALAADFTIATESSSFWLPFVRRGFTPDSGATWIVPRLVASLARRNSSSSGGTGQRPWCCDDHGCGCRYLVPTCDASAASARRCPSSCGYGVSGVTDSGRRPRVERTLESGARYENESFSRILSLASVLPA